MEAVVFSGIQASGKSTFYRDRFALTHLRLNRDIIRTQNREDVLLHACLAVGQSFVVDNTNPSAATRRRYAVLAKAAGFTTTLYFFEADVEQAVVRNANRPNSVPELAVRGTAAKLQSPTGDEGFDTIHLVAIVDGQFVVTGGTG